MGLIDRLESAILTNEYAIHKNLGAQKPWVNFCTRKRDQDPSLVQYVFDFKQVENNGYSLPLRLYRDSTHTVTDVGGLYF